MSDPEIAPQSPPQKGLTQAQIAERVETILCHATLAEKVAMMSGKGFFKQFAASGRRWGADPYRAGSGCERLGVPALFFTDGPRGVARGESTCFPCSMGRGATFDPDLERRVGEAMAIEARAQGCNLSGAVCVNLLRHPAWGRAQETYGEDPHHVGEMGAALAEGLQAHNVIATVKHFALNSIENARFKVDVTCDPRALREIYLPHFKRIIDAGCMSVMSAYNKVNGAYCGESSALLTDILRQDWGFQGFVHSDWVMGVYSVHGAAAGLDIENPEPRVFGRNLMAAVESGAVSVETVNAACRRILRAQYYFACADDPLPEYTLEMVASPTHRALALEVAEKSAVLLKNDGALPLNVGQLGSVALLGRLAGLANLGDNGSSRVQPPYVVTPLEGLATALGDAIAIVRADESDIAHAKAAAQGADACVVVVGYTAREEGEFVPGDIALGHDGGEAGASIGGDRLSLCLPPEQVALVQAACAANPKTVVVLVAGSAVIVSEWIDQCPALLQTFYSGMEGGTALARLLLGQISPSGKLPFSVPRHEDDLPAFDSNADHIAYDLWHGYWKLERDGAAPTFPFGHGLSYARFLYRSLKARLAGEEIAVSVAVSNAGSCDADEVVQLYVGYPNRVVERPARMLKAFQRVRLSPGETKIVYLSVGLNDLGWWNEARHAFVLEQGEHTLSVGGSSRLEDCLTTKITL
jgi:beta-glucosidase